MSTAAIEHVNDDKMEIYYINLKSSTDRAESMRRHLDHFSYPHFRVDAVTYGIYKGANLTDNIHPCELKHEPFIFETNFGSFNKIQIDRLCIAQRNEIKEVVVTLSHIKAIYLAVMSPSTHPYAYIMEDDLQIQFDVDFDALIKLFPPDFGIIQTFVINHIAASGFIKFYEKKHLDYVTWKPPYWSAGGM
jgi:GR25 family glycosyltransferase involved in LPS biosynthesis